ncbi:polyketide synthase dehydratase domain-containing protein, partial [Streptomyces sp. NPDC059176]|uniref:polyketide synthase dehydratase domain-containing protein n=1 Tax=Streptomyces sp. NPDC059176 TaxID=3346758 RepID=UPI0036C019BC
WTTHATGLLGQHGAVQPTPLTDWPPTGTEPVDVESLYADSAAAGFSYGPVFQGLRAAWRGADGEVFAEVALPDGADAASYGIHPALLDAALHAVGYGQLLAEDGQARLPFSWNQVTLQAANASELRVRLAPAGDNAIAVTVADGTGAPVASAASLAFRAVSADQLSAERGHAADSLFHVEWTELPAADQVSEPLTVAVLGAEPVVGLPDAAVYADLADVRDVPDALVVPIPAHAGADTVTAETVRKATGQVLDLARAWLADERFADACLVLVTEGAADARRTQTDLVHAPVRGLIRAAQAENPGRFLLVDVGADPEENTPPIPAALSAARAAEEGEIAICEGRVLVPRLVRTGPGGGGQGGVSRAFGEGTVLVTGG